MTSKIEGICLCGASSYSAYGEVKFAIQCCCRDCQQISGGGRLPQVGVQFDKFSAEGEVKVYQTISDEGNTVEVSFCSECGSPLYKSTSKMSDVKFLCAGNLVGDLVVEPFQKVFEECRRVWDE